MPVGSLHPDWEAIKAQLAQIAKIVGGKQLKKLAEKEWEKWVASHEAVKLPDGFRFFEEDDWMGYAGCTSFLGTIEPIVGAVAIDMGGQTIEATCIVSADEETRTKAIVAFHLYQGGDENEDENVYITHDFADLEEALGFLAILLVDPRRAVPIAALHRFGFKE